MRRGGIPAACDTPRRMNTEYVWWLLTLLLAGVGMAAFLAVGRVPEIADEPAEIADEPAETADEPAETAGSEWPEPVAAELESPQSWPESTLVPGPDVPASTSETP